RRRLESPFHVDRLMAQLARLAGGGADQARAQRRAIWAAITLEGKGRTRLAPATTTRASPAQLVMSRMIVSHYSRRLLERFITVGMALVGRSLYLRHVLREQCAMTNEDLSTANRLFMSLAARFIQYGVPLLAESVRNVVQPVF